MHDADVVYHCLGFLERVLERIDGVRGMPGLLTTTCCLCLWVTYMRVRAVSVCCVVCCVRIFAQAVVGFEGAGGLEGKEKGAVWEQRLAEQRLPLALQRLPLAILPYTGNPTILQRTWNELNEL